MQILQQPISREELRVLAGNTFRDMIKCVADVRQGRLALDADLHADLERLLLENGSAQEDLWGFNLWIEEEGAEFIEFDSLINIRSWLGEPASARSAMWEELCRFRELYCAAFLERNLPELAAANRYLDQFALIRRATDSL